MFGYLLWSKQNFKYNPKMHFWFFLQGITNFSINYMLTYWSETFIKSGVLAITFTVMVYFNLFFSWLFFRRRISAKVIGGSVLGGIGIFLIFKEDLFGATTSNETFGLMLGLCAALSASLGNMVSVRNMNNGASISSANTFGMLYGTLFTGIVISVLGTPWSFPTNVSFLGSLFYLSIVGTVVAFGAYNTLLKTMGAEIAVYSTIISPILAILISFFLEDLKLVPAMIFGIILCLAGNVLVLYKPKIIGGNSREPQLHHKTK